jgi:hypothetical protein
VYGVWLDQASEECRPGSITVEVQEKASSFAFAKKKLPPRSLVLHNI